MNNLPKPLSFQWDKGNIEKNSNKHNINNKEAEEIFFNRPLQIFADLKHSQTEQRFEAFGITDKAKMLTIIFMIRDQKIRIISARIQNKKERRKYEKEIKSNSGV